MEASIQLTFLFSVKCLNITRELKKLNVLGHIDAMFTARYFVSAASSPGQRLVMAMWLCSGLGQAWRLLAAKGVEKINLKIKNGSSKN